MGGESTRGKWDATLSPLTTPELVVLMCALLDEFRRRRILLQVSNVWEVPGPPAEVMGHIPPGGTTIAGGSHG